MSDSRPSVTVTVRSDNAVTVPAWFREKHGIGEGDKVEILPIGCDDYDEVSEEDFQKLKEQIKELY